MPKSKKRRRRDGTMASFRPGVAAGASRPVAPPDPHAHHAQPQAGRALSLPTAVGSDRHLGRVEDAVVALVNEARAMAGAPPLRVDERLRRAARAHSDDMARRGFHAHENLDGLTPADRMRAHGHPAPGGENIARGQGKPHEVMHAWLNSPGHRVNILNPDFATIGVGLSLAAGGPWWTQNFGY